MLTYYNNLWKFILFVKLYAIEAFVTYQSLCMSDCFCGHFNHPLQKENMFLEPLTLHQNGQNTNQSFRLTASQWIIIMTSQHGIVFPTKIIFCQNMNLRELPQKENLKLMPAFTAFFHIQGKLEKVTEKNFNGFDSHLEYLDLSHNNISIFSFGSLRFKKLRFIDLRYNNLKTIRFYENFGSKWDSPLISIRGNPLICNCELATTLLDYVIIAKDDFFFCDVMTGNFTQKRHNARLRLRRVDDITEIKSLFAEFCQNKTLVPSQLHTTTRERHPATNISDDFSPQDEDMESSRAISSLDQFGSPPLSERRIDVPLLLTMTAWFMMLYLGITKFIRENANDYESHAEYIRGLGKETINETTT